MAVRRAILQHMIHITHFIIGHHVVEYASIQEYRTWTRSMHGVLTLKCLYYYRLPLCHIVCNTIVGRGMPLIMWIEH